MAGAIDEKGPEACALNWRGMLKHPGHPDDSQVTKWRLTRRRDVDSERRV